MTHPKGPGSIFTPGYSSDRTKQEYEKSYRMQWVTWASSERLIIGTAGTAIALALVQAIVQGATFSVISN